MDLDIEKIHNILVEANLPSSINDLKNPTEEFVVNLIDTFLKYFHINVGLIDKPTLEQQDLMSYFEDSDIIGLINLHVVMVQICDRIFLKDLCITDITSPGSKKVRKQAKFIANFILYANNKESDIQERVNEIHTRAKMLQDMIDKKNDVRETANEKALLAAKQLSLKEKYLDEIKQLQSRIEKTNKTYLELVAKMNAAEERKQQAAELCGSYRAQALKLNNAITKLQSVIVKSPEEYETRLRELEEQCKLKVEERVTMQEAFQDKKHLIEQKKNILSFIQKELDQFPETKDIYGELKKLSTQAGSIKKQAENFRDNVTDLEKKLAVKKDEFKEREINGIHTEYDDRVSPLRKTYTQFLNNKKLNEMKLGEEQVRFNEICLERNTMQSTVKKLEEEILVFSKSCQEIYDNEIMAEDELWKIWNGD